jgi:hypothetical protein
MSEQKHAGPQPKPHYEGWTEIIVHTNDSGGQPQSRIEIRSNPFNSLDFSIDEWPGMGKRTKFTSFRLEEPAARALYAQLQARYAPS